MFELVRSDLEKYKQVYDLSKEYETMYSPFTPLHHYTKEQMEQLPKKHSIIDLHKVMSESASPEEIQLLHKQIQALCQERVVTEKKLNEEVIKGEQRVTAAEKLSEKLEKQLEDKKLEFEEYKKNLGQEVKRLRQEIADAEK